MLRAAKVPGESTALPEFARSLLSREAPSLPTHQRACMLSTGFLHSTDTTGRRSACDIKFCVSPRLLRLALFVSVYRRLFLAV